MRLAELLVPAPREVRLAGLLIVLPGLLGTGFAFVVLFTALLGDSMTAGGNSLFAEAVYYLVLGGGTLAVGVGLALGHLWARSPALVVALILGGVAWYMLGPSSRPELGFPLMLMAAGVIVLLFREPSRAWALSADDDTDDDANRRR